MLEEALASYLGVTFAPNERRLLKHIMGKCLKLQDTFVDTFFYLFILQIVQTQGV